MENYKETYIPSIAEKNKTYDIKEADNVKVITEEKEIYSNITLEEIAKRVNISRSYLKTLFAKYCDIPPKEYYRKLRLRETMQLLLDDGSVSEIAERMNFSYPNNFTEFFKNETGMSPTEYKTLATEFRTRS